MLQHYRGKQRNYLQWRSQQDINQVGPNYYPPHLRNLRNEWFTKRQEMSKRQEGAAVGERSPVEAGREQRVTKTWWRKC
jgi:hypothetical protein